MLLCEKTESGQRFPGLSLQYRGRQPMTCDDDGGILLHLRTASHVNVHACHLLCSIDLQRLSRSFYSKPRRSADYDGLNNLQVNSLARSVVKILTCDL